MISLVLLLAAQADAPARVAVTDLDARRVPAVVVSSFTEALAAELGKDPRYSVMSGAELLDFAKMQERRQVMGCVSEDCTLELGRLLDVDQMVRGALSEVGGNIFVSLSRVDAKSGKVLGRATHRATNQAGLLSAVPQISQQLLDITARVILSNQVAGGQVYIDDVLVGTMPMQPFPHRGRGEVTVRTEHFDHAPFESFMNLTPGRTTRLRLDMPSFTDLESAANTRRWLGGVSIGVGVAIGVLAGLLVADGYGVKSDYDALDVRQATQAELDELASRSRLRIYGGYAGAGVGAGLIGLGIYLLVDNPHADRLAQFD